MTNKQKFVHDYIAKMSKVKLSVVIVRTSILLAVISSASVALGTYAECVSERVPTTML
jgi:hypothetical protein